MIYYSALFLCKFLHGKSLTLARAIESYRTVDNARDVYKDLDAFVTYCDEHGYRPRTIIGAKVAVQSLLTFCDVELRETKLKAIAMPRPSKISDEVPDNETIRQILSCASPTIPAYVQVIFDTGFEPIDAAQLKVEDLRQDEEPVRVAKEREKTGEQLEGFLSKTTLDALKPLLTGKRPDAYIFTDNYKQDTVDLLRASHNRAVIKAGFRAPTDKPVTNVNDHRPEKIKGHVYGKLHLKVYKKRWFTLAITSGVPEYVAQGILGRKQYLDQYMRLPIETKRDYARKILAAVNVYAQPQDTQLVKKSLAILFGLEDIDDEQLKTVQALMKGLLRAPKSATIGAILAEAARQ